MEKLAQALIILHASFGSIALIAGLWAIAVKKGKTSHKRSGLVFYYAMVLCGLSALIIALMPQHESPFLFAVGVFSLYFVLTGKRTLRYKIQNTNLLLDKILAIIMILTGLLMIVLPMLLSNSIHIVLTIFGLLGIIFASRDILFFRKPDRLMRSWLPLHIGKMLGGYIAAATAFVVVNDFFPSFYGWFIPGILGGLVIAYWIQKLKGSKVITHKS